LKLGFRGLMISPTPVIVPPVPTPPTKISICPSVSLQISSAVVSRWIFGLAGFLNCCGIHEWFGHLFRPQSPFHCEPKSELPANASSKVRRSTLIVSGIVNMSRWFLTAEMKARAIPVFPLVGR
jgi:hypothetical protein